MSLVNDFTSEHKIDWWAIKHIPSCHGYAKLQARGSATYLRKTVGFVLAVYSKVFTTDQTNLYLFIHLVVFFLFVFLMEHWRIFNYYETGQH